MLTKMHVKNTKSHSENWKFQTRETQNFPDLCESLLTNIPNTRRREGQIKMLRTVAEILAGEREQKYLAVEGGTGVGKSFGYLLPATLHAVLTGRRVIVATGTKNLQEQLYEKDAPMLAGLVGNITGKNPTIAILLGKYNYLCQEALMRRIKSLVDLGCDLTDVEERELDFLHNIEQWFSGGGSGVYDHLPIMQGPKADEEIQARWWSRISAADDSIDCKECGFNNCPFARARENAATADVVIANHHLVATDYVLRDKIDFSLFAVKGEDPPEILIIDEAHDFPDAFRGSFETYLSTHRWSRLNKDIQKTIDTVSWFAKGNEDFMSRALSLQEEYLGFAAQIEANIKALFHWANTEMKKRSTQQWLMFPGDQYPNLKEIREPLSRARGCLYTAMQLCDDMKSWASVKEDEEKGVSLKHQTKLLGRIEERVSELDAALCRCAGLTEHYRTIGATGDAVWFDGRKFTACPVRVADKLAGLWDSYENVILTSATLFPFPQSDGFDWFRDEFGFTRGEIVMGVVPSPFRYFDQMTAFVATHPDLKASNGDTRAQKIAEFVNRAYKYPGGIMVLFTSYHEMNVVVEHIAPTVPDDRILLVQGKHGGKADLLARFKSHGNAVLFGVSSFWQGVDIPGDALSTLIVAKIPFPRPDEPLIEALSWLAGRTAWKTVIVPLTAMTLRQGVGRLIRTENDRGYVVITDPRAIGKHRWFLKECLPVPLYETK